MYSELVSTNRSLLHPLTWVHVMPLWKCIGSEILGNETVRNIRKFWLAASQDKMEKDRSRSICVLEYKKWIAEEGKSSKRLNSNGESWSVGQVIERQNAAFCAIPDQDWLQLNRIPEERPIQSVLKYHPQQTKRHLYKMEEICICSGMTQNYIN
jgi:hypothetical protein